MDFLVVCNAEFANHVERNADCVDIGSSEVYNSSVKSQLIV